MRITIVTYLPRAFDEGVTATATCLTVHNLEQYHHCGHGPFIPFTHHPR